MKTISYLDDLTGKCIAAILWRKFPTASLTRVDVLPRRCSVKKVWKKYFPDIPAPRVVKILEDEQSEEYKEFETVMNDLRWVYLPDGKLWQGFLNDDPETLERAFRAEWDIKNNRPSGYG